MNYHASNDLILAPRIATRIVTKLRNIILKLHSEMYKMALGHLLKRWINIYSPNEKPLAVWLPMCRNLYVLISLIVSMKEAVTAMLPDTVRGPTWRPRTCSGPSGPGKWAGLPASALPEAPTWCSSTPVLCGGPPPWTPPWPPVPNRSLWPRPPAASPELSVNLQEIFWFYVGSYCEFLCLQVSWFVRSRPCWRSCMTCTRFQPLSRIWTSRRTTSATLKYNSLATLNDKRITTVPSFLDLFRIQIKTNVGLVAYSYGLYWSSVEVRGLFDPFHWLGALWQPCAFRPTNFFRYIYLILKH